MKRVSIAAALSVAVFAATIGTALADPTGEWRVADGSATIRISHCGADFCGHIATTVGAPGKDVKNPDPAKRKRSVIGLEVLINMKPAGANVWSGTTYNAQDGQIYNAKISLENEQSLQIQGCVPNGGLCGSETWSRVR